MVYPVAEHEISQVIVIAENVDRFKIRRFWYDQCAGSNQIQEMER